MPRILITGSRDWTDVKAVHDALQQAHMNLGDCPLTVLVHGDCPAGADRIANDYWVSLGLPVERHPADWKLHGRSAGPKQNQEMVTARADLCLAFIRNGSKGATGTAAMAEKSGIVTRIYQAVN